jgi:hypothetical protein
LKEAGLLAEPSASVIETQNIFKHYSDVGNKQVIEVILQKEARTINIFCAISSKSVKKSLRKMKSFTPLSVAMRFFDNPNR